MAKSPQTRDQNDSDRKKTVARSRNLEASQLTVATLASIAPATAPAGDPVTITATGTGFVDGDTVVANGAVLATTFVSDTTLTAMFTAADAEIAVRCADGDTDSQAFDAAEPPPPLTNDPAALLAQLLAGDTSGLAGAHGDAIDACRVPYKEETDQLVEAAKLEYSTVYGAILAEMARKGVPY